MFDLAQLESGNVSFSQEIVSLKKLFVHLCNQFKLDVENAELDYQWAMDRHLDTGEWLVEVDVQRMEQVMASLISNAIKHTSEGSISIGLALEADRVIFSVADDGAGISKSEINYIFDRFYKENNQQKQQAHGLGLAITKEIIQQHNGKIWAEVKKERGAFLTSLYRFS
ncbi:MULTISPECIES: sensor histidine kinase [Clostridia]|uniref:sensor histidine kinase n=1 Tax=Clostridia TaxID=186801 RepID=UPI000EA09BF2|nr:MULTISPECIES: sensor histidine kinase [Clostridia]NBJ71007.1 sensor histidine kinase [Roseburia sp. 1XD42-34]RKI75444.1 sensor histidine kinase [Clostridium sp. 1xD42-85]